MDKDILLMPKIDLHLHLDGSVKIDTVYELLNKKVSLKEIRKNMCINDDSSSLSDYLKRFDLPIKVMQSKENLERIAFELVEELEKENVIYAEVRFAPFFHTKEGLSLDEVITSVLKGLRKGKIKVGLILCLMRGSSFEDNKKIVFLTKKYQDKGVVGFDLAGDEGRYPNYLYKDLFILGKELGLNYTIHSGEGDGASSVLEAIKLGTKRIGHGVRCDGLIDLLKENNITLEVCPSSNIDTKIVSNIKDHPFMKLYSSNVLVTVNTDNRTVSNTNLTREYSLLKDAFNLKYEDFIKLNINSVNAAFISSLEKKKYIDILKKHL